MIVMKYVGLKFINLSNIILRAMLFKDELKTLFLLPLSSLVSVLSSPKLQIYSFIKFIGV